MNGSCATLRRMALALTYAEYKVQLGAYADAKAAGDYASATIALDNAIAIRAVLPDAVALAGGSATLANMAQLLALKSDLVADTVRSARIRPGRVIGLGVSHPSSS